MPYLPLLAALAFALSPVITGSFGGFDPQDFPDPQNDPAVQPAGWAFAIWGPIYLALIVHAAIGATRRRDAPGWAATRLPLTLSLAVGAVWIPVARASPLWATALILVMLAGAVLAWLRSPGGDRLRATTPLGLYAGWLLAASCVSLGLLAAGYGIMGEIAAARAAIALALIAALALYRARPSVAFPAAIAWALLGVAVHNVGREGGVLWLAAAGAALMTALAVKAVPRPG